MKILLIDDHVLFRQGLKFLLSDLSRNLEFFEADNCEQVPSVTQGQDIDIVLLDLHMPDSHGLDGLIRVREILPASTIVVLSSEDNPRIIREAIDQGAAGFIPKSSTQELMIAALRIVLDGSVYLPRIAFLEAQPVAEPEPEESGLIEHLSDRQREVLVLAIQGKANKIIARELDVSEATVKAHLSACFRVLGVKNRTEAVYAAANAGLSYRPQEEESERP